MQDLTDLRDSLLEYFDWQEGEWPSATVHSEEGFDEGLIDQELYQVLLELATAEDEEWLHASMLDIVEYFDLDKEDEPWPTLVVNSSGGQVTGLVAGDLQSILLDIADYLK